MMCCAVCNGHGYRTVPRDEVAKRGDCPPRVLELQDAFYACRTCDKLCAAPPRPALHASLASHAYHSSPERSGDRCASQLLGRAQELQCIRPLHGSVR
eukprot:3582679-Prymnesium_polylepis.3